jgi:hypothetical protein
MSNVERQAQIEQGYQASANAASQGRGTMRGRMEVAALAGAEGAIHDARLQILATAMVVVATPVRRIQDPYVKCASRKGTWLATVGTVLMAPTFQKKGMQEQSSLLKLMIHGTNGELEKLAIREKYKGKEQIHGTNDGGMKISHIGQSVINTPNCQFTLKNVLHVSKAYKNLVSVYRLTKDNSVFLEIHLAFFLIKDQVSRRILLSGRSHRGLYPIPDPSAIKQLLAVFRPSLEQWHSRLGHPSYPVVAQVVSHFKLPILDVSNKQLMPVNMPRVINYPIRFLIINPSFL